MRMVNTNRDWVFQEYVRQISKPKLRENEFYVDDNGNFVLTSEYLKKRGSCCGNGCTNCPYTPKHTKGTNLIN